MGTKEYAFKGTVMNGFVMLFVNLSVIILAVVGIVNSIIELDRTDGHQGGWLLGGCILLILVNIIMWCGHMQLEPICIFRTKDINEGWDGTYLGVRSPVSAYLYVCNYTTLEGEPRTVSGTVTLLR